MKKILSLLFIAALLLVMLVGCTPAENTSNLIETIGYGNIAVVLVMAALVLACVLLLRTKYKAQAAQILLYLVTQAETQFGGGTGQLKYAAVSAWLYERLPAIAQLILPVKVISSLIEEAVIKMKEYLEANEKAKALVEITNTTLTAETISPVVNITTHTPDETAGKIVEALKKATSAINAG